MGNGKRHRCADRLLVLFGIEDQGRARILCCRTRVANSIQFTVALAGQPADRIILQNAVGLPVFASRAWWRLPDLALHVRTCTVPVDHPDTPPRIPRQPAEPAVPHRALTVVSRDG